MSELEKPKKPRTEKQIAATEKLVAANKLKREAKLALKNKPVVAEADECSTLEPVVEPVVTEPVVEPVVAEADKVLVEPVVVKPKRKYVKKPKPLPKPLPEPEPEPEPQLHYSNHIEDSYSDSYSDDELVADESPKVHNTQPDMSVLKIPRRFRSN